MDAAAITIYVEILLAILVAVVVTTILFALGRRARKEETLVGFTPKSRDEKYVGYSLLIAGLIIVFFSVYEMVALLIGGVSNVPFSLSDITIAMAGQTSILASGKALGLIAGISTWLLIIVFGGREIAELGLDMLKGRKVRLRRSLRKTERVQG